MPDLLRPTLAEVEEFRRVMYYGPPGRGKTPNAAAAAKLGKVVYIDADGGLKAGVMRRHGIPLNNIEPFQDISYEGLDKLHQELLIRLADDEDIFAVVWDTSTKVHDQFLEDIMQGAVTKAERIGKDRSEFDVHLDDRGVLAQQLKKLLRRYHGLPCHLIICAHQRKDQDDDGAVQVRPYMSPKIIEDFNGWMDCVIHCRTEEFLDDPTLTDNLEFSGLTRPAGIYEAKDRFGLLPKNMINPSFDRVLAYLNGDINKDTDPLQVAARDRRKRHTPNVVKSDESESGPIVEADRDTEVETG